MCIERERCIIIIISSSSIARTQGTPLRCAVDGTCSLRRKSRPFCTLRLHFAITITITITINITVTITITTTIDGTGSHTAILHTKNCQTKNL